MPCATIAWVISILMQKEYEASLEWFGKYLRLESGKSSANISDAYNRVGGLLFYENQLYRGH